MMRALLTVVLGIILVACGSAGPSASPSSGGTPGPSAASTSSAPTELVLNARELEAKGMYATSNSTTLPFWGTIFEGLTRRDVETNEYIGVLAQSWEVIDPTTWRFHLYPEARFSDGTPVTAADVRFSVDRMKTDPTSLWAGLVNPILEAVVVDDHTVDLKTDGPRADVLNTIGTRGIQSKAYTEAQGFEAADEAPVGSGPYELVEWLPGERYVTELRDDHWAATVNPDACPACAAGKAADRVVYRFLKEPEVEVTALLNGEIDATLPVPFQFVEQVEASSNARVIESISNQHRALILNPITEPLKNVKVRQAIYHAIDSQAIIDGPLAGGAVKLDGPFASHVEGWDPNLPKRAFDQDVARQLLVEAGYPDGFEAEMSCPDGYFANEGEVCAAVADMLGQVGITVNVRSIEYGTYNTENRENIYQMFFQGPTTIGGDASFWDSWLECDGGRNAWCNPAWEEAYIRTLPGLTDKAERIALIQETVWPIMMEEVPVVPLWNDKLYRGIVNGVSLTTPESDGPLDPRVVTVDE